ncbi:hypothetical protein WJX74_005659 [Apatococcus lobatus]|uniref:Programmed cell death protein 5 n=1 Tax=Apatococcus lobatus TaxID=904363 RepID=A0AAW1QYH8_9CHLO
MADPELERIRQKRMQELMGGQGGGEMTPEAQQQKEEQRQSQEEQRRMMLAALLQPAARERLNRIALVKPDKARGIEDTLLRMAQRGQISERCQKSG